MLPERCKEISSLLTCVNKIKIYSKAMKIWMLAAVSLMAGCGGNAYSVEDCNECGEMDTIVEEWAGPPTYSFDPNMPAMNQVVARDVFEAWCEAVGYCPLEAPWAGWDSDGAVSWTLFPPEGPVAVLNGGHPMLLNGGSPIVRNTHRFWLIFAHEVGHYQIRGHRNHGLMIEDLAGSEIDQLPLEIDSYTVAQWYHL
jgi:hypothetical protein